MEWPRDRFGVHWTRQWVASTADYSIFLITPEGKVTSWNPGGARIEGYRPEEIIGQHFSVLYTDDDRHNGVAHDFNNVLQVLRGNLELLENRHRRDAWSGVRLAHAIDAVERGAKLASQLLAFGRRQALRPVVVNLAAMVRGIDSMLARALGETINVETVVAAGLWNTLVDIHQLEPP